MNLSSLGLSALNAAQKKLSVVGHNINNANTVGYNRQSVLTSTAGSLATGSGFYGRGVQVDTVMRSYNDFLTRQLIGSQSRGESLTAYGSQIAQVNNLLSDRSVGISPALQNFFDGIQAVASSPADPAARQELLTRTESMVGQFNEVNNFLNSRREDINTQVNTISGQINSYAERIAKLNQEIQTSQGASGHAPNDLLDQRDLEVAELNKLIDVKVLNQGDQYTLTIGNGQLLVSGSSTFKMSARPADDNPRNTTIYIQVPGAAGSGYTEVPMSESTIKGGALGGLLSYRRDSLDGTQLQLGQLAAGLALAINQAQRQGVDMQGATGKPFFTLGQPDVIGHTSNTGQGIINATLNLDGASALQAADYQISYDGINYTVLRMPEKAQVHFGTDLDNAQIDGMTVTMTGTPAAGDSWLLSPVRDAAGKLQMQLTGADQIAASTLAGGSANGENALAMAKLQTSKILGSGTMSFNESYSQIVNRVGVQSQQNIAESKAQTALINQNYDAQQAVSGVNLNEEYANLDRYMEQFAAASKLIEVSASMFDTLLSIRS
jgi:flagellar hook-associated protein 1 FlgK